MTASSRPSSTDSSSILPRIEATMAGRSVIRGAAVFSPSRRARRSAVLRSVSSLAMLTCTLTPER